MATQTGPDTNPTTAAIRSIASELPTDQLKAELLDYLKAVGGSVMSSATDRLGKLPGRVPGLAGRVPGLARGAAERVTGAGAGVKEKVKDAVSGDGSDGGDDAGGDSDGGDSEGGGGGPGGGVKATNIVEAIDVGVPIDVAYNQWTQFADFPDFMKKVEDVQQESETEHRWRARIFMSHREWTATIVDQVPDQRIVWRSEAAKGRVDGAVSFHALAPDLTRIMVVLQYHPQGFFEKVGNLWRAQGRRARLELKNFQRHVMTEVALHPEELDGWRGEIHDGEVTKPHQAAGDAEQPEPERRSPPKRQSQQRQAARSGTGRRSRGGER